MRLFGVLSFGCLKMRETRKFDSWSRKVTHFIHKSCYKTDINLIVWLELYVYSSLFAASTVNNLKSQCCIWHCSPATWIHGFNQRRSSKTAVMMMMMQWYWSVCFTLTVSFLQKLLWMFKLSLKFVHFARNIFFQMENSNQTNRFPRSEISNSVTSLISSM